VFSVIYISGRWTESRIPAIQIAKLSLVDDIKIDLREVGSGGMDWIDLAQVTGTSG
jgi:hypothetical protein